MEKTEVVYGEEKVLEKWAQCAHDAKNEIRIYADSTRPLTNYGIKKYLEILEHIKQKGIKIRYITEVSKSNIHTCKTIMKTIPELRHLDGLIGAFGVTDDEFVATATLSEERPKSHAIYSNVKQLVDIQKHIFETLWNKSIPAERKLHEIQNDLESEFLEVINDHERSTQIISQLVNSITKDAILLLPHSKSMSRLHRMGILDNLMRLSTQKSVQIKILCPINEENELLVNYLSSSAPHIKILNVTAGTAGILLVDNSRFFITELNEKMGSKLSKAMGFGVFSNSVGIIQAIKSFFELLWKSDEINERLKAQDRLQAEFINIASHEIKTPLQSLISYSELLYDDIKDDVEYINGISRNAKRLKLLANNLLDLTKIQNKTMLLNKTKFDLVELISVLVNDFKNQIQSNIYTNDLKLEFHYKKSININADRERITQVISNLLSNAIKCTSNGTIFVILEHKYNEVLIHVKDTGTGIYPDIFPRLFSKFTTSNSQGTGVGLYISKNIVESHGGKIWARNNANKVGATFSFLLPYA